MKSPGGGVNNLKGAALLAYDKCEQIHHAPNMSIQERYFSFFDLYCIIKSEKYEEKEFKTTYKIIDDKFSSISETVFTLLMTSGTPDAHEINIVLALCELQFMIYHLLKKSELIKNAQHQILGAYLDEKEGV
jgi:hypothetical protein